MGRRANDLTNRTFGNLKVIECAEKSKNNHLKWLCECKCGAQTTVSGSSLLSGRTQSCGCMRKSKAYERAMIHGHSGERLYSIWYGIKQRCYNKKAKDYHNYGGRRIFLCEEWLNDFTEFYNWALENGYSESLSIDRIDNCKGYSPDNCRWVTNKVQQNHRRNNILLTYNGKTQTMKQWSEEMNISYQKLQQRIKKLHWSIEKALSTP